VDLRRLRPQEWLTGLCGAVLIASTFLHWYGAGRAKRNAWESFGALDVLLVLVGLMAVALAIVTAAHRAQAVPTAIGSLLVLLGVVVSAWLVYRVASPPDVAASVPSGPRSTGYRPGTERELGLWIGLVACLGTTVAALASIRDDRFPRAVTEAARVDIPTFPAPPRDGAGEPGS
jgi:uncharacterized membrane protein